MMIQALYDASFSVRNIGSCGLDSVRVIKGQFGAHINTNPKPWDIAIICERIKFENDSLNGEPLDFAKSGPFIISNHGCYKDILTIINRNGGHHI